MSKDHSEPWSIDERVFLTEDLGLTIAIKDSDDEEVALLREKDREKARIIVARVNYCAGAAAETIEDERTPRLRELMAAYPDPEEVTRLEAAIAKAEAQRDALLAVLKTREVKEAIGRFRGVSAFFDIGDCSAECDGNTLADAIEDAIAKGEVK